MLILLTSCRLFHCKIPFSTQECDKGAKIDQSLTVLNRIVLAVVFNQLIYSWVSLGATYQRTLNLILCMYNSCFPWALQKLEDFLIPGHIENRATRQTCKQSHGIPGTASWSHIYRLFLLELSLDGSGDIFLKCLTYQEYYFQNVSLHNLWNQRRPLKQCIADSDRNIGFLSKFHR